MTKALEIGQTFEYNGKLWMVDSFSPYACSYDVVYPMVWGRRWIKSKGHWSSCVVGVCRLNKIK